MRPATSAPPPDELNQLVTLYNTRRYAELESKANTMVGRYPASGFAWKLLGAAQQMQGKNALEAFSKTAKLLSGEPDAHFNLGVAQKSLGLLSEAASSYRRAVKLNPKYAEAYDNLGNVLKELGQNIEAVASFRKALSIKPNLATTHNNLGSVLKEMGQLDEAMACYRRAIAFNPKFSDAFYNLGNALLDSSQPDEAAKNFRAAVTLKPDFPDALMNLGTALKELSHFDEAIATYQQALKIKPEFAEAYGNIGSTLKEIGRIDDAIANYTRALDLKPDFALQSSLLFIMNYTGSHTPEYRLEEARKYSRLADAQISKRYTSWKSRNEPKRLRVGMVSGDLRNHPVGFFLESLLAHIDPARIELIAYSAVHTTDALSTRIKPHFSKWKSLAGLSDEGAARMIHDDGVHVLLDLSGHTRHSRLPVFAWKPAPIQVAWLGYFASTGLNEMDYLIADHVGVSEANRTHFTEQVWYLPETRLCFSPPDTNLPVAALPAVDNGYVTFGCFQNLSKVSEAVLSTWADALKAVPDSRLRWQCKQFDDAPVVEQMLQRFEQLGIESERISLRGGTSRETYLAAHGEVDMLLDTFPYPGGTTTCEALWMGVPTLTLAGDTLLSRQGASMLTSAGLPDWIADSREDFVAKAALLSGDVTALSDLRAGLRDQVRVSSLFDAPRFAHDLEEALWAMWQAQAS